MTSTTIKDVEITIAGLSFIVDYRYYSGCPATYLNPADEPSIDLLSVEVKGQPEADADSLLTAIKINVHNGLLGKPTWDDGYDLLEQETLNTYSEE